MIRKHLPLPVLLLLAGCSSTALQSESDGLRDHLESHPAWRASPGGSVEEMEGALPDLSPPNPPLRIGGAPDLEILVRLVQERNPALRAALKRAEAALEQIPQSASAPAPDLRLGLTSTTRNPFDPVLGYLVMLMQTVLFPGKLEAREKLAFERAAAALETVRLQSISLRLRTARAVAGLRAADETLHITLMTLSQIKDGEKAERARYAAGESDASPPLRLRLRRQEMEARILKLRRERLTLQSDLLTLLGSQETRSLPTPVLDTDTAPPAPLPELLGKAFERHPAVSAATHRMRAALEGVRLSELDWWPDVTARGTGESLTDMDDRFSLALSMHLAFLRPDKRSAADRQTRALLGAAAVEYRSSLDRIAGEVRTAHARVGEILGALTLLQNETLPDARRMHETRLSAYRSGRGDLAMPLESRIALLDLETKKTRLRADLVIAREALRHATGEKP